MSEREPKMIPIDRAVTLNLWAPLPENHWEKRRDIIINILQQEGFTNRQEGVFIPLQEVLIGGNNSCYNPLEELREALGFTKDHVHFFPTREGGKSGTAIITNLPVSKKGAYDIQKRTSPEDDIRNIGLLDAKHRDGVTILGVTHLSYDVTQNNEARLCIKIIRDYLLQGNQLDADKKEQIARLVTRTEIPRTSLLIGGDLNADRKSRAYQYFTKQGLIDYTYALHVLGNNVSWPVDVDWLNAMHQHRLQFDASKAQRWMDYFFGVGLIPLGVRLLGTQSVEIELGNGYPNTLYASDHVFPAVYFR